MKFSCPVCGDELEGFECTECEVDYPEIGEVPLLVPSPEDWCATYRDAALATLAEFGRADSGSVDEILSLAAFSQTPERMAFGDDWTSAEARGEGGPQLQLSGSAREAWSTFSERVRSLDDVVLEICGENPERVVEIGPGSGALSEKLSARASSLCVMDLSLRSVLLAATRSGARAVVGDASWLPLSEASVDTLVAVNVIDLVDDPRTFLERACDALAPRGRLVLTTPAPEVGLETLTEDLELKVTHFVDGVPWLRQNSARHHEVYAVQVVALSRE